MGAGGAQGRQWRLLATARALDCTSIVVAVDQAEPLSDDSRQVLATYRSRPLDRRGAVDEVLLEQAPAPSWLIDLDLDSVAQARKALPVLANSRFSTSLDR